MVCKMLFFDFSETEKPYFDKNFPQNFEIIFFKNSLNKKTIKDISQQDLDQTSALSVYTPSLLSGEVIDQFKNLRVISTRSADYKHIDLKTCLERNIAVVNVETIDKNNKFHILQTTFKAVTGVLCGCKDNRIV